MVPDSFWQQHGKRRLTELERTAYSNGHHICCWSSWMQRGDRRWWSMAGLLPDIRCVAFLMIASEDGSWKQVNVRISGDGTRTGGRHW